MHIPKFADMKVETPVYEKLFAEYKELEQQYDSASLASEQIKVLESWNELRKRFYSWSSLVGLHFRQDTRNKEYKKQREYRDELASKVIEFSMEMKKKFLESSFRKELEQEFGRHVFDLWDTDSKTYSPAIEEDLVEEMGLCAKYTELIASATFEFEGERLNLPALAKYFQDQDRGKRYDAQKLHWEWFRKNGEELDLIFDGLTKLRTRMSRKLHYENFIELGYYRMSRIGFGEKEIKVFRSQVREQVVPLCLELKKKQAERLGIDKVMAWDSPVFDKKPNPAPRGDYDWMIARAQKMFNSLNKELGEFFFMMKDRDLFDLKAREGKASGGFCTSFALWGTPFIFANFNGTKSDVNVFTHEMGHAFQFWSAHDKKLLEYRQPTLESCEVHSMSLEFLTWPFMEYFFEEDAARYRTSHLEGQLLFLPYGVAVDHFQHLVYENPGAAPAERHAMWRKMEETYLPWLDYGDLPFVTSGGRWQSQQHIFHSPFYYIDYVLAATCALQFWIRSEENPEQALKDYIKLCKRGGEAPFEDLVKSAGLASPFQDGCLKDVVEKASERLLRRRAESKPL